MRQALRLAVIGDGKMGRAIASLAPDDGFDIVALLGEPQVLPGGITRTLLNRADIAIEFTAPGAAAAIVRGCLAARCPVVSGTTGWDAQREAVEHEVREGGGAMLWAPNFSPGVSLFARMVEVSARLVGGTGGMFDAHIVETHHRAKQDAPSGTARLLAEHVAAALGRDVGVTSVRTGSVPGEHEVIFDAPFEQVRLIHVARDRRVFAAGALMAARWLVGKQGVYTFDQVLEAAR